VADVLMTHVLGGGNDPALLAPHANIVAYRHRCHSRPAWKKTYAAYCERVEIG
jgi:glutathione S-transferase